MKLLPLLAVSTFAALPALAQETRHMDSHEHGVSTLELAIDGNTVELNLTSPGADIVGFEYDASTDADKDAVQDAIRLMLTPENIIILPDAAKCRLTEILAHLHGGDHGDEGHGEHAEAKHSEFHLRYIYECEHADDLTEVSLPFFDAFQSALEIEAIYVTDAGAGIAEIKRDAPTLNLQ